MKTILLTFMAVAGTFGPAMQASTITQTYAGSFPGTISGTLPDQGSVLLESFTLPTASDLTIATTSYETGGFEPNLLLFNSSGDFLTGGTPSGSPDPNTGLIGDMNLQASDLAAGSYTVAVTDFLLNQSLTATNLSDGFTENYGSGTDFVDANGNTRTGNYAFTIDTSAVPEPSSFWLAVPLLAGLFIRARKLTTRGTV